MSRSLSTKAAVKEMLAAWLADVNGWATGTTGVDIALFTNDYVPAGDDTLSNFTACTVSGASALVSVMSSAVMVFPDGTPAIAAVALAAFTPAVEPDPPVTAFGYFVKGHSNSKLLAARRFDDAIPLHSGESIVIDVITPGPIVFTFNDPALP